MAKNNKAEQTSVCDGSKITLSNGGYECPFCGSRDVTDTDKSCRACAFSFDTNYVREEKERSIFSGETIKKLSQIAFVFVYSEL